MAIISLTNAAGREKFYDFELNGRQFKAHKLTWGETIRLIAAREGGEDAIRLELMRLLNDMKANAKDKAIDAKWMDGLLIDEVIALQNFLSDPEGYDPNAKAEAEAT